MSRTAVIVGAGPAGLTAAFELQRSSDVRPLVFEMGDQVGGISRTINYRGNRMDLGGHRFFSKSDWVMNWWQSMLPVAARTRTRRGCGGAAARLPGRIAGVHAGGAGRAAQRECMLVRSRLSRIFYRRRFFDYPLKLNLATLANLGVPYTAAIGASYLAARLNPRRPERTLEDFLVNRFGDTLYRTFFKDYTEKVWGVPCAQISAEWGAQRIKGLSISKAHRPCAEQAVPRRATPRRNPPRPVWSNASCIRSSGPGQMWEHVAARVVAAGGEVHLRHRVVGLQRDGQRITAVEVRDETDRRSAARGLRPA